MKKMFLAMAVFALVMMPMAGMADSRTTPDANGVIGAGRWADGEGGFKIDFNVTNNATAFPYTYCYELYNKDGSTIAPEVSHLIIEVSSFITPDNIKNYLTNFRDKNGTTIPDSFIEFTKLDWTADPNYPNSSSSGANNGNPNLKAPLYGLKINSNVDDSDLYFDSFCFDSTQVPVWGDFYAKDGAGTSNNTPTTTAQNTGIGTDPSPDETVFTNWILTPDTTSVVPIPGSLLLLGSGILGLVGLRRKLF